MDIFQNPFYLLGAHIADDKFKITELAEEKSLFEEATNFELIKNILITPNKRTSAEISWLYDLSQEDIDTVVQILETNPREAVEYVDSCDFSPLSDINILSTALKGIDNLSAEELPDWLQIMAERFEYIDTDDIIESLNEIREDAGFSTIQNKFQIEKELETQKIYYKQTMLNALDKLSSEDLLESITVTIEEATEYGTEHAPSLLESLIDSFEVEAQLFLNSEEKNITAIIEKIYSVAEKQNEDSLLQDLIKKLISVVENWDRVAQPIQLCKMAQGVKHAQSDKLSHEIRSLALDLHNKYKKTSLSYELTEMIQEVFAEVASVVDLAEQDSEILEDIIKNGTAIDKLRKQVKENIKEINFTIKIGLIFKDTLSITSEGLTWKNSFYPLTSISAYSCGGTRINNVPSYYLRLYTKDQNRVDISLSSINKFSEILAVVWRVIGFPLLLDYFEGLEKGEEYTFGNVLVTAKGVVLSMNSIFKSENFFCEWTDVFCFMRSGALYVQKKSNSKIFVTLDVLKEKNVQILEHIIENFKKDL